MPGATDRQLDLTESRIEGVQLREHGKVVLLELFVQRIGGRAMLTLHDLDRMRIDQFREQNVIESLVHWNSAAPLNGLREVAFSLIAGQPENECPEAQKEVVAAFIQSVAGGEKEVIAISAVYGAEVLASFKYMRLERLE